MISLHASFENDIIQFSWAIHASLQFFGTNWGQTFAQTPPYNNISLFSKNIPVTIWVTVNIFSIFST